MKQYCKQDDQEEASLGMGGDGEMLRFLKPLEEIVIPSQPHRIRDVRVMTARVARRIGLCDETVDRIELAVGEACANAVEHGSPRGSRSKVRIRCSRAPGILAIEITDQGHWREPIKTPAGEIPLRGRGIPLMSQLVDGVEIEATETGTRVRLLIDTTGVRSPNGHSPNGKSPVRRKKAAAA